MFKFRTCIPAITCIAAMNPARENAEHPRVSSAHISKRAFILAVTGATLSLGRRKFKVIKKREKNYYY